MTPLAACLLLILSCAAVLVVRRLREGDVSTVKFVSELERADKERQANAMKSSNDSAAAKIGGLPGSNQDSIDLRDPTKRVAGDVEVPNNSDAGLPLLSATKVVVTTTGRVPENYSLANH